MTDLQEKAMRLALDVLGDVETSGWTTKAAAREVMQALRQALAQEQVPVAHLWECIGRWTAMIAHDGEDANLAPPDWLVDAVKATTAPPKKEWQWLTEDEVDILIRTMWNKEQAFAGFVRSIEAKLKEKNT